MDVAQSLVLRAIAEYVSPPATRNIVTRALAQQNKRPKDLSQDDWLALLQGPLLEQLRAVTPIGMTGGSPFRSTVKVLSALAPKFPGRSADPEVVHNQVTPPKETCERPGSNYPATAASGSGQRRRCERNSHGEREVQQGPLPAAGRDLVRAAQGHP